MNELIGPGLVGLGRASEGAIIGGISSVVVAIIALVGVIFQARRTRSELKTNNHHTIGEGVAHLEEVAWRHEQRLDTVEILARQSVQQQEDHLVEIGPMANWVKEQMAKEEGEP